MKCVDIYLIRHGQTVLNEKRLMQGWSDAPLTDDGVEKALLMGDYLSDVKFDKAISSDLRRALDTCELILSRNQSFKGKIFSGKQLREMHFGKYESDPLDTVWESLKDKRNIADIEELSLIERVSLLHDPIDNPRGESRTCFENRVMDGFMGIVSDAYVNSNEKVLVVSHGVTIAVVLQKILNEDSLKTSLPNASLCRISYDGEVLSVREIGVTP